ncbi:hypothetical protein [Chitinophaga sancti]|uniref:Uncharacterized protein n=1 Tax=Chitinophaga sancti TaxID=1004 RepID=A0A1K1S636_9BACT|nr:hypothetical protein [Chitinophaga sancti]WQD62238.1 hypothetical protein U0033_30570 [Chitinophaga sancti]WQG92193.1 hypothetical protein SR876_11815 [Chitinophaga sancti]SFW79782.1 hypothetical protein SAMN05661012_04831 [Chitinophaga sancti]
MKSILLVLTLMCTVVFSSRAQYYNDVVSAHFNAPQNVNGIKIKTNLPFIEGVAMPTIMIEGYDYNKGKGGPIDLKLTWYVYENKFNSATVSSSGMVNPPVTLANENGKVSIFLDYKAYYMRFHIRAYAKGLSRDTVTSFMGWTVVDSTLIPEATNVTRVSYKNAFTGIVNLQDSITATNGKLGINTLSPRAPLDVATVANDTISSVLGRLTEGNTVGDGTYLGVKTFKANADYIPSFGLISKYGGTLNCGIIFNKGTSVAGYLTFLTNTGIEQMRLDANGNLLIGVKTAGAFKLAVAGTIGAKKLTITQSGWADYVFHPDYKLPSLAEVEAHIQANHRLPEIPSEKEIYEKGLDVAEMQKLQMQKIEELTLYLIEEHKANLKLQEEVAELKKKLENK